MAGQKKAAKMWLSAMIVSEEDHETMLKFLDAHRNEIWVTTFQEATDYLISYRQRNKQ